MGSNKSERDWIRQMSAGCPERAKGAVVDTVNNRKADGCFKLPKRGAGFDDVAGMDELKLLVTESFINVLNNMERARLFGIRPPSLLFYGPSGCGKSFFAERMAEEVGINFIKVIPDDIASTLIHGTQKRIGEVFRKAERKAPTLLFFDEFDAMVPARSSDDKNYQNGEVNEFLCLLNNAADNGVYVLAATNYPERIDKAVLRKGRIDELIFVGMPDFHARESLFKLALSKLPAAEGIDCGRLATLTNGYNCSDIEYIIKSASRLMFNEGIKIEGQPLLKITQAVLEDSISKKSPSLSSRDIWDYERMRCRFEPKASVNTCLTIGFK